MAILQTTVNYSARGHTILELTPSSPVQHELVDSYLLRLWIHDQLIYERIQSVRNWQMRHYYIEQIAIAFTCVKAISEKEIECEAPDVDGEQKLDLFSFVHTEINAEWLTVSLAAVHTKQYGDLVHVSLYLRQNEKRIIGDFEHRTKGQWGEWEELIGARIICKPEDAIAFGKQLLVEIRGAEMKRIELGIPDYDDAIYYGEKF